MQEHIQLLITQKSGGLENLKDTKPHHISIACEWKRLRPTTHLEITANFECNCMQEMCPDSLFSVYITIYTGQKLSRTQGIIQERHSATYRQHEM